MSSITFLVIGPIAKAPTFGEVKHFPRCAGLEQLGAAARLYQHHIATLAEVDTPYFCLLDGGEDSLLSRFESVMLQYQAVMDADPDTHIVYGDEVTPAGRIKSRPFTLDAYLKNHLIIHHGVLCRTATAKALVFPSGCHVFEVIVYGALAMQGAAYLAEPCYKWVPSFRGARTWPETVVGLKESKLG